MDVCLISDIPMPIFTDVYLLLYVCLIIHFLSSSKDYGKSFNNITNLFPDSAVLEWYRISSNADIVSVCLLLCMKD